MKANFVSRHPITDTITSFAFKPQQPISFTAGQYIDLGLTGHHEGGQAASRKFTLSSPPNHELFTVTTRVGSAAHSAYKRALDKLVIGAEVDFSEPTGDFVLPRLLQTPLVFIAGGIGITPFRSILAFLAETGEQRPISMFYAIKTEDDIIFQDVFDAAKQHVTIIVDKPSAAWGGERGELTAEMILGLQAAASDTLYYVSGPEPFVQSLLTDLRQAGIDQQKIVTDEFQGYSEV